MLARRVMRVSIPGLVLVGALSVLAFGCDGNNPPPLECGASNCSGCCAPDGTCQTGDTDDACGSAGKACSTCISGNTCQNFACIYTVGMDGGETGDAGMEMDGGVGDGGMEMDGGITDGGMEPTDGGTGPITAPDETWTWVDFPDAVCGNDSPTGIGINPTTKSSDVFIYLEGGGACWNSLTCFTLQSASNLNTGYGMSDFATDSFKSAFAVDRTQSTNPFKDMSYVYVPYCTGDVHAGDSVQQYDSSHPAVHHAGAKNMEAYLKRLAVTFPNAAHIYLGGSSAGAFGAQLNYERVVAAFPNSEVHVLADSGQMITPAGSLLNDWMDAWNLTLPAGCTGCDTDFTKYPEYLAVTYPDRRFALLAFDQDQVLRTFFGYSATDFQTRTNDLLTQRYDPHSNAKYFELSGSQHTMLGSLNSISAPGGMTLNQFVTDWVQGNSSWTSVRP